MKLHLSLRRPAVALPIAMAAAALAALTVPATADAASTSGATAQDVAYIRGQLKSYDVPQSQQDALVTAWAAGKKWDSESGAQPVSETTARSGDNVTTIRRYADGSLTVSAVEDPAADANVIRVNDITACSKRTQGVNTFLTHCSISWNAITWSMGYFADYRFNSAGPAPGSAIYKAYGITIGGAGTFEDKQTSVLHSPAGKNDKSHARGQVDQSTALFKRTVGIDLYVSPTGGHSQSFGD